MENPDKGSSDGEFDRTLEQPIDSLVESQELSAPKGVEQDPSGDLHEDLFLKLLRFTLNEADAVSALRIAIEWGRYGELFEYNYNTGVIHLNKDEQAATSHA